MTARIRRLRSGILSAAQVADMHGRSVSWFWAHWAELAAAGHPQRDALLGGWHHAAVRKWIDNRAEQTAGSGPATGRTAYQSALEHA
jgi:predicted DNA-binding transcriptional regulator AlpA